MSDLSHSCHLWAIFTLVTQHFGLRSWGLPKGSQYWSVTFSNYLWATCCHLWAIFTYDYTHFGWRSWGLLKRAPNTWVPLSATICEQLASICERYWPMVTQHFDWRSWGLPKQLFVSNLPAICERYLLMVTQHFGWRSWRLPKQLFVSDLLPFVSDIYLRWHSILAEGPDACQSNYLWATCCHFWAIVTYGDSAFWLEVLRLAIATICEQLAAICER